MDSSEYVRKVESYCHRDGRRSGRPTSKSPAATFGLCPARPGMNSSG